MIISTPGLKPHERMRRPIILSGLHAPIVPCEDDVIFEVPEIDGFSPKEISFTPTKGYLIITTYQRSGQGSVWTDNTINGEPLLDISATGQSNWRPSERRMYHAKVTPGQKVNIKFDRKSNRAGQGIVFVEQYEYLPREAIIFIHGFWGSATGATGAISTFTVGGMQEGDVLYGHTYANNASAHPITFFFRDSDREQYYWNVELQTYKNSNDLSYSLGSGHIMWEPRFTGWTARLSSHSSFYDTEIITRGAIK